MPRSTIDIGIDLGTTNSAIAVSNGPSVSVLKNNENHELTPSAIWFDRRVALHVGRRAKEQSHSYPDDSMLEFKLHMGTAFSRHFARADRDMTPEELSAEVLKSLRGDVQQQLQEDVRSAVITVPALFDLPENEATRKAAKLAGFEYVELLQEPIAAALAYGIDTDRENVFWLVYDFGGGTFDAAVVHIRDGAIQVVNHGGDKYLGGKNIDWAIVEQLLVPAVIEEFGPEDFDRGNPAWIHAFAQLKDAAEKVKIELSRKESYEIVIDDLFKGCAEYVGESVEFTFMVERSMIEPLMEPFIARSLNICRRVLAEKNLAPQHIERVLLVGGPTLIPYFRDRIKDGTKGLGISLDSSQDPMTVVARGAAIYAATQRNPIGEVTALTAGSYAVELDYKPVSADAEPVVGGKVSARSSKTFEGFTIEFINRDAKPQWRSGKLPVAANGAFMTTLWAVPGFINTFDIALYESGGGRCPTAPDHFTLRVGKDVMDPPLTHTVGVALEDNRLMVFFEKGTPLPCRKTMPLHQAFSVRKGTTQRIVVAAVEGENLHRADRNRKIGSLEITGNEIHRDLPRGTQIDVTLQIDKSRLVSAEAYVPLIDQYFEMDLKLLKPMPEYNDLKDGVDSAMRRLEDARRRSRQTANEQAQAVLQRIEDEKLRDELYSTLGTVSVDAGAGNKVEEDLLKLQSALDEAFDSMEWPTLVEEAERELSRAQSMVRANGDEEDKTDLSDLESDIRQTIRDRVVDLLRIRIQAVRDIYFRVYRRQPAFWIGYFDYLVSREQVMSDPDRAAELIDRGRDAARTKDIDTLRLVVGGLYDLLPQEDRDVTTRGFGSTLTDQHAGEV